jgi:hypothetical protein
MLKGILLQALTQLELILTFWNRLTYKKMASDWRFCYLGHISKSNEITIINTCGIILIFDYLGSRKTQSLQIKVKEAVQKSLKKKYER